MSVPLIPLTPAEHRVARLVSLGADYARIGERLDIAEDTAARHVCNISAKLPNPDNLKPYTHVLLWAAHIRWLEEYQAVPRIPRKVG